MWGKSTPHTHCFCTHNRRHPPQPCQASVKKWRGGAHTRAQGEGCGERAGSFRARSVRGATHARAFTGRKHAHVYGMARNEALEGAKETQRSPPPTATIQSDKISIAGDCSLIRSDCSVIRFSCATIFLNIHEMAIQHYCLWGGHQYPSSSPITPSASTSRFFFSPQPSMVRAAYSDPADTR